MAGKGDKNRSDFRLFQAASYWDDLAIRKMIHAAELDGWLDIHGGYHGAYWRGINPETKRCEKLPEKFIKML